MTDSPNTVVPTHEDKQCRLYTEHHHAKLDPTEGGDVLWRAGGYVFVKNKIARRCVRGIPLSKELWFPGDGKAGEPANENIKGGRYPLQEEYKAKRLGKTDEESDVLWSTAKWFASHHDIANRPYEACSYGIGQAVKVGELGGFVDPEQHEEAMGSSDPI